jgi:hypothetical protein
MMTLGINDTEKNNIAIMLSVVILTVAFYLFAMLSVVMLSFILLSDKAKCHYAESRGATHQLITPKLKLDHIMITNEECSVQ